MEHHYIECACDSGEHTLRITSDPGDEFLPLWLEIHLVQYRAWYARIWVAVRYVFGYRSKYGSFDTVCLDAEQAERLIGVIRQAYPDKVGEIPHERHQSPH